jgi:hypothetical protein
VASIFDELAAKYPGLTISAPPDLAATQQIPRVAHPARIPPPLPPPGPPPWPTGWPNPPLPPVPPSQGCPACAEHDRPWVLVHRHLDHMLTTTHARIGQRLTEMEHLLMAAIDNANEQLASLNQVVQQSILPVLSHLAQVASTAGAAPSGPSEEQVQAIADGISSATSQLAAAAQAAVAQLPQQPAQ